MASKTIHFLLLIVRFSLVVVSVSVIYSCTAASWKNNEDVRSTTVAPGVEENAVAGCAETVKPSGTTGGALVDGAPVAACGEAASRHKKYSANSSNRKGNNITDEDLQKLSEALFLKDTNNAIKYITLNLQNQKSRNGEDEAPLPLLTVNSQALELNTIAKVRTIYDNYKPDTRISENISLAQRDEESQLVDTFLTTNVMSAAMDFLADKGMIRKDHNEYKDVLLRLWFSLYCRSRNKGKISSSGFEHVFLTELKNGIKLSGFHNWIYFNAEEDAKRANYLGYYNKVDLGDKAAIIKFHVSYNSFVKPVTSMFIGTSPELEMALYTVCFYARPKAKCPMSIEGIKFNIMVYTLRYRNKVSISSAYPVI